MAFGAQGLRSRIVRRQLGFAPPGDSLARVVGDAFGIVGTLQADAFRVDEPVAEGGFAVVYRARHTQFRADVALKCLKVPGTLAQEQREEFLERFRTEAELLFRLSSAIPAIVRPIHIGQLHLADQRFVPFMALEWLEGHTLAEEIEQRTSAGKAPYTIQEMLMLLTPVAKAIERAHQFPGPEGPVAVLHRDIKPENLFIATSGGERVLKILDFGIAKVKRTATQLVGKISMDQSGVAAFTPTYAAPEQWLPKRFGQTGTWTDVWGLALTSLEAILGHSPIEGDLAELMGTAIDTARRPTPRNAGLTVSDAVEAVFTKALAVSPRERYASVAAFWTDLEKAVGLSTDANVERSAREGLPLPEAPAAARRELPRRLPSLVFAGSLPSSPVAPSPRPPLGTALAAKPAPPGRSAGGSPSGYGELDLDDDGIDLQLEQPELSVDSAARATSGVGPELLVEGRFPAAQAVAAPGKNRAGAARSRAPEAQRRRQEGAHPPLENVEPSDAAPRLDVNISAPAWMRQPGASPAWRPPPVTTHLLARRLSGPLKLLALSLAIMAADWLYTINTGELVAAGPIRPLWVAGPLGIAALGIIIYTVLSSD